MNNDYYDTISTLEQSGVHPDYIQGWAGAYMGGPKREEQRGTDAYDAGYADGEAGTTETAGLWTAAEMKARLISRGG